ncbi:MAG: Mov34/MPN/PAD-1 family protein [Myxococcota bacterium]|nr:Mov34/MPN/PAD-1 family protein [Myxococcota bacterium]
MTPLPGDILRAAARAVEAVYPQEGCGLILQGPDGLEVLPVPNISATPRRHFELAPGELLRALRLPGHRLDAIFHSHPDGSAALSAQDRLAAAPGGNLLFPGVLQVVFAVEAGRARRFAVHRWFHGRWEVEEEGDLPLR